MGPTWRSTWIASLATVLLSCGGTEGTGDVASDVVADNGGEVVYDCYGVKTTIAGFESAPSVAELRDDPGAAAFADLVGDLEGWRAVVIEGTRLGAIRVLDPPDTLDGDVRDHERVMVELIGDAAGPDVSNGWMMTSAGPCVLRAELGHLGPASVFLDGDGSLDPNTSKLDLLVVEQSCASGQSATGRVQVDVDATADEIRLLVGVEPAEGAQTCPSNPATPVTVDLDEPIGDRRVVDVSRYPEREVGAKPV
jgi:hypothetical protein